MISPAALIFLLVILSSHKVMIAHPDIGLATLADAAAIARLSRDEIEHGLRWSWTPARVRRAILDRDTNVVIARDGSALAGFALMQYRDAHAHLSLLAVAPTHRRRGIATALLAWIEVTFRIAGVRAVQVELRASNISARAFYEKLGFEQINATSRYYQGSETALHMVKELSSGPE